MPGKRSDQRGLWEADWLYLDYVGKDTGRAGYPHHRAGGKADGWRRSCLSIADLPI